LALARISGMHGSMQGRMGAGKVAAGGDGSESSGMSGSM